MNKKKILTLCLVACLAITAIAGASLAYFTDTKSVTNTFTVGNVKIELLESSLHRENAGVANGATSTSELWSDVAKKGFGNQSKYKAGDTFYTDEQIEANAKEYKCNNISLIPDKSYHKMPYVKNIGKNDAYVRIRIMIPADLDTTVLNSSMYTTTALNNKEFTLAYDDSGTVKRTVDGNEVSFNVYTLTRIDPLAPDEMTYWNAWGTIHMDKDVTAEEIESIFEKNPAYANGVFPVLVEADAIQSEGFVDTKDEDGTTHTALENAWTAFDKA